MNTKSKTYMQGEEFKNRQGCLAFFNAWTRAAHEKLVEFKADCIKGWKALFFSSSSFKNITLPLPFDAYQENLELMKAVLSKIPSFN